MRRARRRVAAAGIAAAAVLIAACSSSGSTAEPDRREPRSTSTTTTTIPVPTAPLTGLPDPQGIAATRPSLGVKIENTPDARPQSGLDQADIVYEEVVEGGITRFWAFFNSAAPEVVGPIRSVRMMDPNIILPFGGVVAFSGGTPENVDLVRATGLVTVDENNAGAAFFREPTRRAPHNLYGYTAALWGFGGTPVPPPPQLEYVEESETFTGEPIVSFHINFDMGYDVAYLWDAARGGWGRYNRGIEPFMATGFPEPVHVAPNNVIVQFIPYGAGADGDVMGSGEVWVFSNGQLIRGTWAKPYSPSPTLLLDAAGQPIRLTPGRTWVELVPIGTPVDVLPAAPPAPPSTTATSTPPSNEG